MTVDLTARHVKHKKMQAFCVASDEDEGLHTSAFMEGRANLSLYEKFGLLKAELFGRV